MVLVIHEIKEAHRNSSRDNAKTSSQQSCKKCVPNQG